MKIAIINGPNLNLTGKREPEIYGRLGFDEFLIRIRAVFPSVEFAYYQSNLEGEIVTAIQRFGTNREYRGIILNAGAYSHTSIAIADAVAAVPAAVIGVHMSNIYNREPERRTDLLLGKCEGHVVGLGMHAYEMAAWYLIHAALPEQQVLE